MKVNWENDFNTGRARARDEGKFVFLDFYNPT